MANINDGPRSRKLREVFRAALDKVVSSCSADAMHAALPRMRREVVEKGQQALVDKLHLSVQQEFEVITEQRQVFSKLHELDKLVAHSSPNPNTVVDPTTKVRAFEVMLKRTEIERIQTELEKVQDDNQALIQHLATLRERYHLATVSLQRTQQSLRTITAAATTLRKEDLWSIIQTTDTEQIPQPAKPRSSSLATGVPTDDRSTVEIETGSSPVKKRRTSSFSPT